MIWLLSMSSVFLCSFLFFKQKTAYEMRISDWSSDVCSSDLLAKIKLARGCRWNRRDIFVERQFGFLPNAGILGVARFAFLLIGLRFLRSRPLRLRQQRPVIGAWLRRSADGWRRKDPSHQSAIAKIACLARADRRDPRRTDNLVVGRELHDLAGRQQGARRFGSRDHKMAEPG